MGTNRAAYRQENRQRSKTTTQATKPEKKQKNTNIVLKIHTKDLPDGQPGELQHARFSPRQNNHREPMSDNVSYVKFQNRHKNQTQSHKTKKTNKPKT